MLIIYLCDKKYERISYSHDFIYGIDRVMKLFNKKHWCEYKRTNLFINIKNTTDQLISYQFENTYAIFLNCNNVKFKNLEQKKGAKYIIGLLYKIMNIRNDTIQLIHDTKEYFKYKFKKIDHLLIPDDYIKMIKRGSRILYILINNQPYYIQYQSHTLILHLIKMITTLSTNIIHDCYLKIYLLHHISNNDVYYHEFMNKYFPSAFFCTSIYLQFEYSHFIIKRNGNIKNIDYNNLSEKMGGIMGYQLLSPYLSNVVISC